MHRLGGARLEHRDGHLVCRRALVRVRVERRLDDGHQRGRHRRPGGGQQGATGTGLVVRRAPGQRREADGAEAVHIGRRSGCPTGEHRRVEEAGRPGNDASRTEGLAHQPADPEVAEQRSAVAREENIGGRHVAVDQGPRVHRRQRARQRHRDRDDLARMQPAGGEQACKAAAAGVVEHQHQLVGGADNRAQPHDVRMLDAESAAASRRNRSRAARSRGVRSRLSATGSPLTDSRASHTSPLAPKPSSSTTS